MGSAAFCLLGRLIYYGCSLKGLHSPGKRSSGEEGSFRWLVSVGWFWGCWGIIEVFQIASGVFQVCFRCETLFEWLNGLIFSGIWLWKLFCFIKWKIKLRQTDKNCLMMLESVSGAWEVFQMALYVFQREGRLFQGGWEKYVFYEEKASFGTVGTWCRTRLFLLLFFCYLLVGDMYILTQN